MSLGPSFPIVGTSGISPGTPFTPNKLALIVSAVPPVIADSLATQSANGRSLSWGSGAAFGAGNDQIAIGTSVVFSGNVTGIVGIGNNISSNLTAGFRPSILIGNGIVCNVAGAVIINSSGTSITHVAGSASVVIGDINDTGLGTVYIGTGQVHTVSQSRNVCVGFGVNTSLGGGGDNVIVGAQSQGNVTQCVLVGSSISTTGSSTTGAIAIGYNVFIQGAVRDFSIVIGAQTNHNASGPSIVIASGLTTSGIAIGSFVVGGPSNPITSVLIGRGQTSTTAVAAGLTVACTNGVTGNNLNMGFLTINAPLGTGNAPENGIRFNIGQAVGAGNAPHTQIRGGSFTFTNVATETTLELFDNDTASTRRVTVGAANSGGAGFKLLRIPN